MSDLPHHFQIQACIIMNQPMAEADDLRPGHLRILLLELWRDLVDCFANNHQLPQDSILEHSSGEESLPRAICKITLDGVYGLDDIQQTLMVTLHTRFARLPGWQPAHWGEATFL